MYVVGHERERVLGRVGRAVDAAARDFAREAAQLENGGGREAAAERLVEQQVEVVARLFVLYILFRQTKRKTEVPSTLRFRKFPGKTEGVWCSILETREFP